MEQREDLALRGVSGRAAGAVDGDIADQLAELVVVGSSGFCAAANREIDMRISSINGRRDPLAIDITQALCQ